MRRRPTQRFLSAISFGPGFFLEPPLGRGGGGGRPSFLASFRRRFRSRVRAAANSRLSLTFLSISVPDSVIGLVLIPNLRSGGGDPTLAISTPHACTPTFALVVPSFSSRSPLPSYTYEPEVPDVWEEAVVALTIDGALFLLFALPHAPVILFLVSRSVSTSGFGRTTLLGMSTRSP